MKILVPGITLIVLICTATIAQGAVNPKPAQSAAQTQGAAQTQSPAQPQRSAAQVNSDEGERAFAANCSRCHNPPEQISPRITGTIVRHMRVRANLSAADERALLRFFNP